MVWTDEETLSLIDMYRARPVLWDSSNEHYKNKYRRHDNLIELAVLFGVDKPEIERKIKNLQSHFMRERKKEAEGRQTGSGTDEPYESKWFAFQPMMFLAYKNEPGRIKDDVEDSEDQEGQKDSRVHIRSRGSRVGPASTRFKTSSNVTKTKRFQSSKSLRPKSSRLALRATPGSSSGLAFARADIKDEHSSYGEHIAIRLRRLPPRTRFLVQQSVNQMLFDAESGIYEQDSVPIKS
ncbi:uncharacterized protein LOC129769815 [Toxorhynchites rutilus septentrionalis]|uniref:uncharacterized protein LOC129769815 n=1 Tax=Toxorhynchites rutilus septentrionalis TaxID=329112 RepID=UPI00247AD030|nr:uncharacterized protein LOC129769815 [Toxorhynchites rutilus septentrionalis]